MDSVEIRPFRSDDAPRVRELGARFDRTPRGSAATFGATADPADSYEKLVHPEGV